MNDHDIARVCHEAIRALQLAAAEPNPSPQWDQAPAWQQDAALHGVRAVRQGADPIQLHDQWCAQKLADGWRPGPVKDPLTNNTPVWSRTRSFPRTNRSKTVCSPRSCRP